MHEMAPKMVHRDIKPENIIISNDTAIIVDFGLARFLPKETNSYKLNLEGLQREPLSLNQSHDILTYLKNNEVIEEPENNKPISLKLATDNQLQTLAILVDWGGTANYMCAEAFE